MITATVNGHEVTFPPATFLQLVTIARSGGDRVPSSRALSDFQSRFHPLSDLPNVIHGVVWHSNWLLESFIAQVSGPIKKNCTLPCLKCAGHIVAFVGGTTAGIILGCNPGTAAASGGVSCAAVAFGAIGAFTGTASACHECDKCLNPDPGCGSGENPCVGDEGNTGGGPPCTDPTGCCPSRYHECCTNQCCNDDNPPPCCSPPCP
jgi:hypothetical protein